jgi:lauroyl/myristoyl acyltransferase
MERSRALASAKLLMPIFHALTARKRRRNFAAVLGGVGGWDVERLRALDRAHAEYFARWLVEVGRLYRQPPEELSARVQLNGEACLREAWSRGRGVLLIITHGGTNLHGPFSLGLGGLPVNGIFNARGERSRRFFTELGRRFGVEMLFIRDGAGMVLRRSLARGGIVSIAHDVSVEPKRAVWLPFGKQFMPIDLGPARLALRLDCPVVMCDTWHLPEGRSAIVFRPSPWLPDTSVEPLELAARWLRDFEANLLQRPEQWWLWSFADFTTGKTPGEPLVPARR